MESGIEGSWADGMGARFKSRLLSWGLQPPAAGQARADFLWHKGVQELRASLRAYGQTLLLLGVDLLGDLRSIPLPRGLEGLPDMQRINGRNNLGEWPNARRHVLRAGSFRVFVGLLNLSVSDVGNGFRRENLDLLPVWNQAESAARNSLDLAVDAFNCLEDTEIAHVAHGHMHNIAALVSGYFGCKISSDEGIYYDTCPLVLAHHRWGSSVGFTSQRLCSICGEDIDSCAHLLARRYPIVVVRDADGCNACARENCNHVEGETVEVFPSAVIASADLHEVSCVRRPRDPHARLAAIEIDARFMEILVGEIPDGRDYSCMRCLHQCNGFHDPGEAEDLDNPVFFDMVSQGFVRVEDRSPSGLRWAAGGPVASANSGGVRVDALRRAEPDAQPVRGESVDGGKQGQIPPDGD